MNLHNFTLTHPKFKFFIYTDMEGISTTIYMPNTALPKTNQEGRGLWHEIQHNRAKGNVNKWTSLQTYKDKTRQPDYIHKYTHMSGNPKEWAKGRMWTDEPYTEVS